MATALLHFPPTNRRNLPSTPRRKYFPPKPTAGFLTTRACASDPNPLFEAAKLTVDKYIRSGMVVGLGSGRASGMVIQYLGQQLRRGALQDIIGVPTSVSSASEAAKAGIPLEHYPDSPQVCTNSYCPIKLVPFVFCFVDFAVDDADIMEEGTLTTVIGRRKLEGGESILQEKVWRRPTIGHSDPLGGDFPWVTREGHNVLDLIFTSPILNLAQVAESLDKIDGVVDHGVISGIPCTAVIASKDGIQVVDNLSRSRIEEV